jgi:tetratricopeptide (TPR) repeat protein
MLTIWCRAGRNIMPLLAAVTLFAGCGPPGPKALLEGKRLLEEGKYDLAVERFKLATTLLGNTNSQAFNFLGLACHQAGRTAEAERAYQHALALNPDLVEARYNLGCLWLSQNRLDQAKSELTAFTLRRPNATDAWLKLGTAQLRSREFTPAEKSFSEALRLSQQNPEALTGLGLVQLSRNRSAREATNYFTMALRAKPDYRPALLNLAVVAQENLKDRPLALRTYREYLGLKPPPDNSEAVRAIVRQLEQEMTPPPAPVTVAEKPAITAAPKPLVTEAPRTALPPKTLAAEAPRSAPLSRPDQTNISPRSSTPTNTVKAAPPQPQPAQQSFEVVNVPAEPAFKPAQDVPSPSAVREVPPVPQPKTNTVSTAPAEPKPKRSFLQRINPLKLFGGEPKPATTASGSTGSASGGSDRLTNGVTSNDPVPGSFPRYRYHSSLSLEPGDRSQAEVYFAQGAQAQQKQEFTQAIQAYRRAAELDPGYFDAQYNLGLAAYQAGDFSLALSSYEKALAIVPKSEEGRYNFALALKQADYPVDAARELERLLKLYPNSSRAHLALGNLYAQQLRQPAKARPHYQKLLELDPRNPQAPAVQFWLTANPK